MTTQTNTPVVLIELDEASWNQFFDRAALWFDNLVLVQSSYRQLLEDTAGKIAEFHIRGYLIEMAERAKVHEEKINDLYTLVHRNRSAIRQGLGTLLGKADQVVGDLMAVSSGIAGPWPDLHQLYLSCTNTLSAFGVAEQIGLALGIPEIIDLVFPIELEKATDQRLLQEFALEMAGIAILYRQSF